MEGRVEEARGAAAELVRSRCPGIGEGSVERRGEEGDADGGGEGQNAHSRTRHTTHVLTPTPIAPRNRRQSWSL